MRVLKPVLILIIGISFLLFVNSLNFAVVDKVLVYFGTILFLLMFLVWTVWRKETEEEVDLTFQRY